MVVKLLGKIADIGDTVSFKGITFTVTEIDGARITRLQLFKETSEVAVNTNEEM